MANPVYIKIVEDIKKKVNSAELIPGDTVPPETALCKEYGVSRMTVRKGLAILANEGYIYSVPGKGSYVQKPEVNKYTLLYDEMNNPINSVDKARLLEVTIIMPDEKLADELQTTRNKHVIMIRRLFYTDGTPVAYDVKYLLYSKGMPIVEKEIEQATFQEMVSNGTPIFALKKKISISAQIPNEEIKRYLNIYDELALLVVEQKLYNNENKPIGIGVTSYRGDYIKLQGNSE
ncbi:GntR family transcriptional regulator [Desulfosporosinus metallidurans]|uniref:Putative transcriptional regulator of N-Acetylglucosamine utilization, GntR family n=1 Tax=Desulfosporosinus metallidurans TaxID=1888891 RepID=A0A1Q8QQ60_9FIRM|nr:GntR family transcriptional regulator [Desulfosporosinus metallidurans]OLN29479.1 putative transcriptional regulator of N-Acetylglucosamine utilization, GntR family [Desulfosporosinus metallidurans]